MVNLSNLADSPGFQKRLPPGAMLAPVILASDETMLTQFSGDKKGWPVYLYIANIPSWIRRKGSRNAIKLLAYLPITKLSCFSTQDMKKEERQRLFHKCMNIILEPLFTAARHGVEMLRADGCVSQVHPVLASYVADFPEQCLVGCNLESRCPICLVKHNKRQDNIKPEKVEYRLMKRTLDALKKEKEKPGLSHVFKDEGLRHVYPPFWSQMLYNSIFRCFTPDLLHQIHKGVFHDHVYMWCKAIAGDSELDRRIKVLPDHPDIKGFPKGISEISQWTGREAKAVQQVFVGILVGTVNPRVLKATRAFIDFVYLASYSSHTTETLKRLQEALDEFHACKDAYIKSGGRTIPHFNFPKLHMLLHYVVMIMRYGTAQGFNTEQSERAHIDLTKNLYRRTNKKGYFKQMTDGLTRQEQVNQFGNYLNWRAKEDPEAAQIINSPPKPDDDADSDSAIVTTTHLTRPKRRARRSSPIVETSSRYFLPKTPSWPNVDLQTLANRHGAIDFYSCLKQYISSVKGYKGNKPTHQDRYHVFKRVTIRQKALNGLRVNDDEKADVVRATPRVGNATAPSRYDTVLVHESDEASLVGVEGMC